jgi:hypothetical protein
MRRRMMRKRNKKLNYRNHERNTNIWAVVKQRGLYSSFI